MSKIISVIIPVFNEEGNLQTITSILQEVFSNINYDYEIIYKSTINKINLILWKGNE